MQGEQIKHEKGDKDAWICICKNTPIGSGFDTCDENGNYLEPMLGNGWNGFYCCADCGRIINQDTLEVVGRKVV